MFKTQLSDPGTNHELPRRMDFCRCSTGRNPFNSDMNSDHALPSTFGPKRSGCDRVTRQDYEEMERSMDNYFNKKFTFHPPQGHWTLPETKEMFAAEKWKVNDIDSLQIMKDKLNEVKNRLNNFNLDEWHKHTRTMNKAGLIQWKLKKMIDPEFLTQAWSKFYENLMTNPLVPELAITNGRLNSIHLCEAPGAFITSLNHYLKVNHPQMEWNWLATTLNPHHEGNPLSIMINDDRFILRTLEHWTFGADNTGNLMDLTNLFNLVKKSRVMGEVLLVTGDGSIDCQEDPGEQERVVGTLHYCEVVAALHILTKGGSFLLKMFTMYESETVCLMYLLCCAFSMVQVFKPATSKEGNSEVYVVCLGYLGQACLDPWLLPLRQHFGSNMQAKEMFPLERIPDDFLQQIHNCAALFMKYQVDVIETNIRVFEHGCDPTEEFHTKKLRNLIASHFIDRYHLVPLEKEADRVVGSPLTRETTTLNLDPRFEQGTFNQRKERAMLPPTQQLETLGDELAGLELDWPFSEPIKWLQFNSSFSGFKITIGKPIKTVCSSKFCLGRLLKIHSQILSVADNHFGYRLDERYTSTVLNESLDVVDEYIFNQLSEKFPGMKAESVKTLNYTTNLWTALCDGSNDQAQCNTFFDIMDIVDDLWRDETLVIRGYPLLTQFNVGIVYMLCHMFDMVGFVRPSKQESALIFANFRTWAPEVKSFANEVERTLTAAGDAVAVISVIPISRLCEVLPGSQTPESDSASQNEFYKCVMQMNHMTIKEQVLDILSSILQP